MNENISTEIGEEVLAELQKFVLAVYTKGCRDTLIGVAVGVGISAAAIVTMEIVEWRKSKRKFNLNIVK